MKPRHHGVDLFAGPGGWEVAARRLGIEVVGIEKDEAPLRTRYAAAHRTISGDVVGIDPRNLGPIDLLIASPPCPDFSKSNRRNAQGIAGARGALVEEVMRWALLLEPRLIACEQVPDVLPIWQGFAARLKVAGWRAWAGILNAADFGVPQTRKRAVLLARRGGGPLIPTPTHASPTAEAMLLSSKDWVTMSEALADLGPYHVRLEEGAPYLETDLPEWARARPSTTVTSGGRVAAPGYRQHDERQFGAGAVRLTIEQAARLQTFPDGYPWQAPRVHQQIGNAIPPRLAEAILETLLTDPERNRT